MFILLSLLLIMACTFSSASASGETILFAVNVGKADALLLQNGDALYLVDTGTTESWGQLSCALRVMDVDHLNGVIVTHTDKDHIGGVMALATSSIRVDAWYASRFFVDVKEDKHPVKLAAELRGQTVHWLSSGDVLPLGDGTLRVLAPLKESEEENDNSLVLLADAPCGRMLLMGDAEYPEEKQLLAAHRLPHCEVLKVSHHGGDDATSDALLNAVRPHLAVISTSTRERPETPAPALLKRLKRVGAAVAETQDTQGGVLVRMEEGNVHVMLADWGELPPAAANVKLTEKRAREDVITIANQSEEMVDLSHWFIRSEKGDEIFVLPAGTMLAPGQAMTVGTLTTETPVDLIWPEKNVWHNKQADQAILCDGFGRVMDVLQ